MPTGGSPEPLQAPGISLLQSDKNKRTTSAPELHHHRFPQCWNGTVGAWVRHLLNERVTACFPEAEWIEMSQYSSTWSLRERLLRDG